MVILEVSVSGEGRNAGPQYLHPISKTEFWYGPDTKTVVASHHPEGEAGRGGSRGC